MQIIIGVGITQHSDQGLILGRSGNTSLFHCVQTRCSTQLPIEWMPKVKVLRAWNWPDA